MKALAILGILLATGCSMFGTPEVVYEDLRLIQENVQIQQEISDLLLNKVVQPQNEKQAEAIALQKVATAERTEYVTNAVNRLILYFKAEQYVDFMIFVGDYSEAGEVGALLQKVKDQL